MVQLDNTDMMVIRKARAEHRSALYIGYMGGRSLHDEPCHFLSVQTLPPLTCLFLIAGGELGAAMFADRCGPDRV